ncbi:MAG: hypothetical protein R3D84_15520 [Paracoccaceae bacterium]
MADSNQELARRAVEQRRARLIELQKAARAQAALQAQGQTPSAGNGTPAAPAEDGPWLDFAPQGEDAPWRDFQNQGNGDAQLAGQLLRQLQGDDPKPAQRAAMLERINAAKAGTLHVSPENRIRAAIADRRAEDTMNAPGMAGGMAAAATDGALFGFGDEYLAGLSAALGVQPDGKGGANWFDYEKPMGERYSTALDAIRHEQGQFAESHPAASLTAEIAGALAMPGSAGARFINKGAGTASRIGRGMVAGGTSGAAYGFGEGEGSAENRAGNAVAPGIAGALGGGFLTGAGQGFNRVRQLFEKHPDLQGAVRSLDEQRELANTLYEKARSSGATFPEHRLKYATDRMASRLKNDGFAPDLHPRVATVLKQLSSETGEKTMADVEILRRIAGNAAQSIQPDERRLARHLIEGLDDMVGRTSEGGVAMREARDAYARLRRMETLETAIGKASLQDDFAAGLRSQFRQLLRNPKRLRGFGEAEMAAIRQVARGGTSTRILTGVSRLLSARSLPGLAITGGAYAGGAGMGAAVIPAVGAGSRMVADALTRKAANSARDIADMSAKEKIARELLKGRRNVLAAPATLPGYMTGYAEE